MRVEKMMTTICREEKRRLRIDRANEKRRDKEERARRNGYAVSRGSESAYMRSSVLKADKEIERGNTNHDEEAEGEKSVLGELDAQSHDLIRRKGKVVSMSALDPGRTHIGARRALERQRPTSIVRMSVEE
jgi:hypothetical protein